MIYNVLLLLILLVLFLIYIKINSLLFEYKRINEINQLKNDEMKNIDPKYGIESLSELKYLTDEEIIEYGIEDYKYYSENEKIKYLADESSNLFKAIDKIKKCRIKKNESMELHNFSENMERYREFLSQSKVFQKKDVIDSINMIKTKGGTVSDYKIFFLTTFTNIIFSNGLKLKDLEIDREYYGYGPSEVSLIWFDIENIKKMKDGGDYKIFEADVIFTLRDKTKKILKYEFYDDTVAEFDKWFKKFEFIDEVCTSDPFPYFQSYKPKAKYRIVLNDLFQYLDFVAKHFYNKKFIDLNFLRYDFDSLLTNNYGTYIDDSWQIDKNNFTYVDKIEKNQNTNSIDTMTDNELFNYALNLYYKESNNFNVDNKIFNVVNYLDTLIKKDYAMAYLVKALLYLDGKIVTKDVIEAKKLLRKAYDLGLYKPSILIWNENKLDNKGK